MLNSRTFHHLLYVVTSLHHNWLRSVDRVAWGNWKRTMLMEKLYNNGNLFTPQTMMVRINTNKSEDKKSSANIRMVFIKGSVQTHSIREKENKMRMGILTHLSVQLKFANLLKSFRIEYSMDLMWPYQKNFIRMDVDIMYAIFTFSCGKSFIYLQ